MHVDGREAERQRGVLWEGARSVDGSGIEECLERGRGKILIEEGEVGRTVMEGEGRVGEGEDLKENCGEREGGAGAGGGGARGRRRGRRL